MLDMNILVALYFKAGANGLSAIKIDPVPFIYALKNPSYIYSFKTKASFIF